MWMQILKASGVPVVGDAFPLNWRRAIGDANPQGFFESQFREGIYHRTNPHPGSGAFLSPEAAAGQAVKVFPYGLVRSDLAYIEKVVVTLRSWRDYVPSVARLLSLEREYFDGQPALPALQQPEPRVPHWVVWWVETFQVFRDLATRRHKAAVQTYDSAVHDPGGVVLPVLKWLGAPSPQAGLDAIDAALRGAPELPWPTEEPRPPGHLAVLFDEIFETVNSREPLAPEALSKMNDAAAEVLSEYGDHLRLP